MYALPVLCRQLFGEHGLDVNGSVDPSNAPHILQNTFQTFFSPSNYENSPVQNSKIISSSDTISLILCNEALASQQIFYLILQGGTCGRRPWSLPSSVVFFFLLQLYQSPFALLSVPLVVVPDIGRFDPLAWVVRLWRCR